MKTSGFRCETKFGLLVFLGHPNAKDWFGQLFLIPGLEKCITYGCDQFGVVNNHFPVYSATFGMVTPKKQTNDQR